MDRAEPLRGLPMASPVVDLDTMARARRALAAMKARTEDLVFGTLDHALLRRVFV